MGVGDLFSMDQPEDAATNAERMQRLWEDEVRFCERIRSETVR